MPCPRILSWRCISEGCFVVPPPLQWQLQKSHIRCRLIIIQVREICGVINLISGPRWSCCWWERTFLLAKNQNIKGYYFICLHMALLLRKFSVNWDAHARFYFRHPCRWRVILIRSKKSANCSALYFLGLPLVTSPLSENVHQLQFECISLQKTYSHSY